MTWRNHLIKWDNNIPGVFFSLARAASQVVRNRSEMIENAIERYLGYGQESNKLSNFSRRLQLTIIAKPGSQNFLLMGFMRICTSGQVL